MIAVSVATATVDPHPRTKPATTTNNNNNNNNNNNTNGLVFPCRYMSTNESRSLHVVGAASSSMTRGVSNSEYKHCYLTGLPTTTTTTTTTSSSSSSSELLGYSGNSTVSHDGDIYTKAIRQLHVSVVPERLLCRESERARIEGWVRKSVLSRGGMKPLYISGMPGEPRGCYCVLLWYCVCLCIAFSCSCC